MNSFYTASFLMIIVLFISAFFWLFYESISTSTDKRYQLTYFLNNPHYNRGHNHSTCPRGCTSKRKCPHGNKCFNCQGDNPFCCCYDNQCRNC